MRSRALGHVILVVTLAMLAGSLSAAVMPIAGGRQAALQALGRVALAAPTDGDSSDILLETIRRMSLDEKIGQLVIVGLDGLVLDDNARSLAVQHRAGGFVLMERNVRDSRQLLGLVNSLKAVNPSRIPLFLAIDEEGGRVTRLPREIERLPAAGDVGRVNSAEHAFKLGKVIGQRLGAFGLNMDFAPVLDVNSNPRNLVIGDRAFGSSPGLVSEMGTKTMLGIRSTGVIPVVKHFPGHGDTREDSHVTLPVLDAGKDRLRALELVPFENAIANGTSAVMIAHILLPRLDPDNPASLSRDIVTGVLRGEMGFDGVVITDDMTMGAISQRYEIGDAAVRAVNAGCDLVLACHGLDNALQVLGSLKKAVLNGELPEARVDESVRRVLTLKMEYELSDATIETIDVVWLNSLASDLLSRYRRR